MKTLRRIQGKSGKRSTARTELAIGISPMVRTASRSHNSTEVRMYGEVRVGV